MKRAWLICLPLVLVLAGGSAACAQDGFYVIPVKKKNYNYLGTPAPVPKTGQTTSYGDRDDGALQKGVAWPQPRFAVMFDNGTVTDRLTGLVWMKNANAFGGLNWYEALSAANNLKSGEAGLTDGSKAGDWRLPNRRELLSLVDFGMPYPHLPVGHMFINVKEWYWSSTSAASHYLLTWYLDLVYGGVLRTKVRDRRNYVWCVRDQK
ncbi:MAG: Lcl C-terminal domain-containing protein [Desulfobaccales bacterium]